MEAFFIFGAFAVAVVGLIWIAGSDTDDPEYDPEAPRSHGMRFFVGAGFAAALAFFMFVVSIVGM